MSALSYHFIRLFPSIIVHLRNVSIAEWSVSVAFALMLVSVGLTFDVAVIIAAS